MILVMRDLDQIHRQRQRVLYAAAIIGLGLLFVTLITASGAVEAKAATTPDMATETSLEMEAEADIASAAVIAQDVLAQDQKQALTEVSNYLSSLENLQGDFLQVGPDGSIAEGKFYLRRPGRLRFEYQPPENLLVVADGTWVAVKDSPGPAQRYPISSTPLNLLLGENVNLAESSRVLGVHRQPGSLLVTLADRAGEAPGQITLIFDQPELQLRQWVVTDAQGLQTTVALRNIETGIRADNALFILRDEQRPTIGGPR